MRFGRLEQAGEGREEPGTVRRRRGGPRRGARENGGLPQRAGSGAGAVWALGLSSVDTR